MNYFFRFLEVDTLIWAKYDDAYYPAFVREILDPRSPKVKVSYCDQGMFFRSNFSEFFF